MKVSALISYKLMAIIGVILSLADFVDPTGAEDLFWGLLWTVVSIFTWKKKIWAVSLLTLLSVITFYQDIILEVATLKESIYELAAGYNIEREIILALGISVFTFEVLILGYVILAGIMIVKKRCEYEK